WRKPMRMTRREIALAGSAALLVPSLGSVAMAQGGDEASVAAAVEALREAIVKADKAKLTELANDKLAYFHSNGRLETKDEFVAAYTSGKNTYKSLTLADHKNVVAGNNAVANHTFAAEIDRGGGKVDNIKIGVTTVWVKEN